MSNMLQFEESVYQLIVETSTNLPGDVRRAVNHGRSLENEATRAGLALSTIARNIQMAEDQISPICQDTGMPTFVVHTPVGINQIELKKSIHAAIQRATKDGKLRPNSVDSLTGENTGNNLGTGTPVIHFEQWEKDVIDMRLILKGGGCENKNIQYSLPTELEGLERAGRDLDGIRKCILHAIYQAQGQGCSAGFLGIGIGGDRTTGYELAKQQLFRQVDDVNPVPELDRLEQYILEAGNQLGIGTMGFGGEVTLLGCKIGAMNRLPASFFVSVAYNCWAFRRQGIEMDPVSGEIGKWLYPVGTEVPVLEDENGPEDNKSISSDNANEADKQGAREIVLRTPISEEQIRSLRVGDVVVIQGEMHTGRDALHKYLMDHDAPVDLNGAVIYHCGPVMLKDEDGWHVKAAGPTTSIREEPYQGDIIKKFGIRAVIGKGGMGAKTLAALKEHGGVYLNAIGGAAQYYAECFKKVNGVDFMEFGIPEAMWHLEVDGFAAIVTMDSHGDSLHEGVEKASRERLASFKEAVFK